MTNKDWKDFNESIKCHICGVEFIKDDKKVRDHCQYTGKYRGAAHNKCNINFKKPKFIPVMFHNLGGYDSHLFVESLGKTPGDIKVIPHNEEKYLSFSKSIEVGKYINKKK